MTHVQKDTRAIGGHWQGRRVLVTGSTDGMGRELALGLASRGATVLIHGRNAERGAAVLEQVRRLAPHQPHRFFGADFGVLTQVRELAATVSAEGALDLLVNNAAVAAGKQRQISADGHELTFQVNFLAGFLLASKLAQAILDSQGRSIVNVAAAVQERLDITNLMSEQSYHPWGVYARSKVAQLLFTTELHARVWPAGLAASAVHPATLMDTTLVRHLGMPPKASASDGAAAVLDLANRAANERAGRYFEQRREAPWHAQANDSLLRRRLWQLAETYCGTTFAVDLVRA